MINDQATIYLVEIIMLIYKIVRPGLMSTVFAKYTGDGGLIPDKKWYMMPP